MENPTLGNNGAGHLFVSRLTFRHMLPGVVEATKSSTEQMEPVLDWISAMETADVGLGDNYRPEAPDASFSSRHLLKQWLESIDASTLGTRQKDVCRIVLALSVLRQKTWEDEKVSAVELADVWSLLHGVLAGPESPVSTVSRSAQGFLAIPLCSSLKNGDIAELWRLHVWLGDGQRGNAQFAIHSHQSFAESWILAGRAVDHSFEAQPVEHKEEATHATFAIGWSSNKAKTEDSDRGSTYKTHQTSSTAMNTHQWVSVSETAHQEHAVDGMYQYHIPSAAYHRTEVDPAEFHATLFVFDSSRGFHRDAGALGPKDEESHTQQRDPAGRTAASLAQMVEVVRAWEMAMAEGRRYAEDSRWEFSVRAFDRARDLFHDFDTIPNAARYRGIATGELGKTNRRLGRYTLAEELLRAAVEELSGDSNGSLEQAEYRGELGAVLRHDGRLDEAEVAFEQQYRTAERLGAQQQMCSSIGNWGMVNYQLFLGNGDPVRLQSAVEQLQTRVQIAQKLGLQLWESIGLSRLSLCYTAQEREGQALDTALRALSVALSMPVQDPVVVALARFFYGRVLWKLCALPEEARRQFEPPVDERCSPAIALCKEPSRENHGYLRELIDVGVDLCRADGSGYTALDWAVFRDSKYMEQTVLFGLGVSCSPEHLTLALSEARLRRGYRAIFQEKLRPILAASGGSRSGSGSDNTVIQELRKAYDLALADGGEHGRLFDRLRFVPYVQFLAARQIPRSSMHLATQYTSEKFQSCIDFVVFISYRWMRPGALSPDDDRNTQYGRMLFALQRFLKENPNINPERLGVWVDYSCIDQDNKQAKQNGIFALPLILVQCDAFISLTSEDYYDRAWCTVEVGLIQSLILSYGLHKWFVCDLSGKDEASRGAAKLFLHPGPLQQQVGAMVDKKCSQPSDWPTLRFLERQTTLLGKG